MKKIFEKYFADSIARILAITFIVGIIAGVFLLVFSFCGVIMRFFGFEYHSVGSIFLFFVVVSILSFPIDLITETLPKVLLVEFQKINLWQARVLYIILNTLCSMICYSLVDYFMDSVHASDMAIFMVSFIISLIEAKNITEKETIKSNRD